MIEPFSLHSPYTVPVEPNVGVTVTVVEIAELVVFVATNDGTFPEPLVANPTAALELVQV